MIFLFSCTSLRERSSFSHFPPLPARPVLRIRPHLSEEKFGTRARAGRLGSMVIALEIKADGPRVSRLWLGVSDVKQQRWRRPPPIRSVEGIRGQFVLAVLGKKSLFMYSLHEFQTQFSHFDLGGVITERGGDSGRLCATGGFFSCFVRWQRKG